MKSGALFTTLALLLLAGCSHIGPKTVTRDRFDYNTAIADSWKEQTLLNIVKLRYADMPLFVEVASVVSGYTLESSVNLGGNVSSANAVQGDFLSLGTAGTYTDRPTITYVPITGEKFNRSFMTPIPPNLFLFLLESGWSAEMVFPIVVDAINGLRSLRAAGSQARTGDPGYYRTIFLLQQLQDSGHMSMRVVRDRDAKETAVLFLYRQNLPPEIIEALKEFEKLLGLRPESSDLKVRYGSIPETDQELALQTRSMLQIMIALATQIDVPSEHVEGGLTVPSLILPDSEEAKMRQLIKVHTTPDKPEKAFVSVNYRDNWFWIDDGDFYSKRVFTFLMILFSLTESGGKEGLPLITIPAG
jgi:hypothetical protein